MWVTLGRLGVIFGVIGAILGRLGDIFGVMWTPFGYLGGICGVIWVILGCQGSQIPKMRAGTPRFVPRFGRSWQGFWDQNRSKHVSKAVCKKTQKMIALQREVMPKMHTKCVVSSRVA